MSVGNTIGTAAAVVGVGLAGVVGWKVLEAARAANALNNAARDIRAAGGDQSALDNVISALRSSGVFSPGREGAVISTGTNQETQFQSDAVLLAAERAMLAAGSGARLSPNLSVVRPKDVYANWKLGEGAWLPSQGKTAGWREGPTELVRGLDMNAYALVYLADVYAPSSDGGSIVAYPKRFGYTEAAFQEDNKSRGYQTYLATASGLANQYDIFVTSTDQQGGLVALWDRNRGRFLTPAECVDVRFAVAGDFRRPGDTLNGVTMYYIASAFLPELLRSMYFHTKFQPFPPNVRQVQAARRDATAARLRAKAGA